VTAFRFSRRADADLTEIGAYGAAKWGETKALLYADQLETCCRLVATNPGIARKCDGVLAGYRRMEQGRHVLFFKFDERGALVVRVLHMRMLPGLSITDDDERE
jgi:toxin ParE1/3/4